MKIKEYTIKLATGEDVEFSGEQTGDHDGFVGFAGEDGRLYAFNKDHIAAIVEEAINDGDDEVAP